MTGMRKARVRGPCVVTGRLTGAPSSFRDRLAALEVPCVPRCKPPHPVPSALKGRSNLFHNSRTIVPACERRDGDGQQLVGGGLWMGRCWLPLCHGNRLVPTLRAIERAAALSSGARCWRRPSENFGGFSGHTRAALRRYINQVAHALHAPGVKRQGTDGGTPSLFQTY
jgi:hypothetical protein